VTEAQPVWRARVFAVDDSLLVRTFLQKTLKDLGYEPEVFGDGPAAIAAIRAQAPDIVLTDLNMPGMDGFQFLAALKEAAPNLPAVMLTGSSELDDALRAIRSGAADYVTKPINVSHLGEVMARILRLSQLEADNRRYVAELAERDEKMRHELELARNIQRALLPSELPELPGFEFGLSFVPSGAIGGDYVDYFYYDDRQRLGVIFADLTGHGVPAALLMVMYKSCVDEIFLGDGPAAEKLRVLNRRLSKQFPMGHFASTTYVEFDARDRSMTCVKASQEPALIFERSGEVRILKDGGPLLGAFDPEIFGEPNYPELRFALADGDTVFLYTDGLVEVENEAGVMLSLQGLIPMLKEELRRTPEEMVKRIHERIVAYAGCPDLPDDFTALAVRLKKGGNP
jgi:phosphoserine phosphatase RsbU/P